MSPVVVILFAASVCAFGCFAGSREWRVRQLGWRTITGSGCQRVLVRMGWTLVGTHEPRFKLDKGPFKILLDVTGSDPATLGAVQSLVMERIHDGRQIVIVVPGAIELGVVDAMLSRQVIVVPFAKLAELEAVLLSHQADLAKFRAYERQMLTEVLDPPVPARLMKAAAPAAPSDTLLAETEHVQCFCRDTGADSVLIAFNDSWRTGRAGRLQPGIDLATLGHSVIDFVSREPNWFPADDMAALLPVVRAKLAGRFPQRITFGFSQGGFGAIKFSRALGATVTLAFSPQFSIDPRVVEDTRFNAHFRSNLNVGMHILADDAICPVFVFHDPNDVQDSRHIVSLARTLSMTQIGLPFAGHGTSRLFNTAERLKQVIALCLANDAAALLRFGVGLRHDNRDRAFLMAFDQADKRSARAMRIVAAYGGAWQPSQKSALYFRFAKNGLARQVLGPMEALAAQNPANDEIQGCAAIVALEAHQVQAATRFVERARALCPESRKWRHVQNQVRESHFQLQD